MKYPKRKDRYDCDLICDNFHEIDHRLKHLEEHGESEDISFEIGVGLKMVEDKLSVDSAKDFDGDNTRPVEAAFMQTMIGNVEILLSTI